MVLRAFSKKSKPMMRQLGPRNPTISSRAGKKERTRRGPTYGPFDVPQDSRNELRLARGLPSGPSSGRRISASLEGSGSTLERATHLRLARGHPLSTRDQQLCRPITRRTGALNANHSSTAPESDGVKPPFCTVAMIRVPSANSDHCSATPGVVTTLWEPVTQCKTCSTLLWQLYCQPPISPSCFILCRDPRTAGGRPSEVAPAATKGGPWPVGPLERRHAMPGGRYPPPQ